MQVYHSFPYLGKRDIRALHVKCDNVDRGCEWKGTVGTLEEHKFRCEFTIVACPNKCKNAQLTRKGLNHHLKNVCPNRGYKCKHCGKKGTYDQITNIHDSVCEKKIIPCSNSKCTTKLERAKLKSHIEEDCEYAVISCKYERIGCSLKSERRYMRFHEQKGDNVHLQYALDALVKSDIKGIRKEIEEIRQMIREEIQVTREELYDNLEPMEDDIKRLKEKSEIIVLQEGERLTFKLTKYDEMKVFSKEFYTSPKGYHMKIKGYPNGRNTGKETHLSVYAGFIDGGHDEELDWPFIGTITIELLNQLADTKHYCRKLGLDNMSANSTMRGYPVFISHTELSHDPVSNTQYLKDDTLYFRVSMEVTNHKPWLETGVHRY